LSHYVNRVNGVWQVSAGADSSPGTSSISTASRCCAARRARCWDAARWAARSAS